MEEGAVGGGTRRRWRVFLWEPREARAEGEEKAGRLAGGRRIWGLAELEGAGGAPDWIQRGIGWGGSWGGWLWTGWQLWAVFRGRRGIHAVVVCGEGGALCLLLLKWLGWLRMPVVLLGAGEPRSGARWCGWIRGLALRGADRVGCFSRVHAARLQGVEGVGWSRLAWLPLPFIPADWDASRGLRERRYGVALVFGEGMDFGTLLEALPLGERLVVLADAANARRVRAHWAFGVGVEVVEEGDVSARRRWCACAQMVIFALKGEISLSVVVELVGCLAMGKLVIVTEHPEAEAYVVHRSNAWVVRAGDAGGLRAAMERFFREGHALAPMREAARRKVREEMGAGGFGRRLGEILEEIRAERARKRGRVWGKSGGLEDHECVS